MSSHKNEGIASTGTVIYMVSIRLSRPNSLAELEDLETAQVAGAVLALAVALHTAAAPKQCVLRSVYLHVTPVSRKVKAI